MENQTQDQTQAPTLTGESVAPAQDVFTPEQAPVLDAPTDSAELPPADPVAADPVAEQPDVDPETAQAAADASDNSTRTVQTDDDTSVTQMVGAQMARARNALAHLEETVAREVHAALAEIESLLGMKD
jgi:hypothetical protein